MPVQSDSLGADQTADGPPTTRLAPSPTGALHLGNARTFLINWALARQRGWQVRCRIDDLDGPRVKSGADLGAIEDLTWLGLDWDGPETYQRKDLSPYVAAVEKLRTDGRIYPCSCSRSQVRNAQSAPHGDDHELRYPGTCRPPTGMAGPSGASPVDRQAPGPTALRLMVPDAAVDFTDALRGPQSINVQQQVGDFVIATKQDLPAYNLAVVVDDARAGVTDVVRGDDLLRATGRQILLYQFLEREPLPRYWHVPLVLGPDGRRLAKRHGDTRLAWYRDQGVAPQQIIGLLGTWCGINPDRRPMQIGYFLESFSIEQLPRGPVVFATEDHKWLMGSG